jgi:hypothetical protein
LVPEAPPVRLWWLLRPAGIPGAELDYELQTRVPDWWIPYLPSSNGYASIELIQGRMLRFEPANPTEGVPVEPQGRILNDPAHARLAEEEVPRAGVRVQRVPVVSRDGGGGGGGGGNYRSWVFRRATAGRGEGRSGLAFDGSRPRA